MSTGIKESGERQHDGPVISGLPLEIKLQPTALNEVRSGTREEMMKILPFAVLENAGQSPFSPPAVTKEDIEMNRDTFAKARGSIVIPASMLQDFLDINEVKNRQFEFDLNSEEDRRQLLGSIEDVLSALRAGGARIVIKGIEYLEKSAIEAQERYELNYRLRMLEDRSGRDDSVLVATVSGGSRIPLFTVATMSPALASALKTGFKKWLPAKLTVPDQKDRKDLSYLHNMPRRNLEDIYGSRRRKKFNEIIERAMRGENIFVFGPRRGGKTSLKLTLLDILGRDTRNVISSSIYSINSVKEDIVRHMLAFDSRADKKRARDALASAELLEYPAVIMDLISSGGIRLSGKRLYIFGDEEFERFVSYGSGGDLFELVRFMKAAREACLPIQFFVVSTNFRKGEIFKVLSSDSGEKEDAHLSAFSTDEFGLLEDDEARELLESLMEKTTVRFASEEEHENFISEAIKFCSGNVVCLNRIVANLERHASVKDAFERTGVELTAYFKIYLRDLNHFQRRVIASLCLAEEGRGVLRDAGKYGKELAMMERFGYVECSLSGEGNDTASLKLKPITGFRLALRSILYDVVGGMAQAKLREYMAQKGVSAEVIEDGFEMLSEFDDVSDERRAAHKAAVDINETCYEGLRSILWEQAKRGEIDFQVGIKRKPFVVPC